jgi:hypothetical protein
MTGPALGRKPHYILHVGLNRLFLFPVSWWIECRTLTWTPHWLGPMCLSSAEAIRRAPR